MSGIFLKSEFKDLFTNADSDNIVSISNVLNKYVKSDNNNNDNNYIASTTINQDAMASEGNFSATSSMMQGDSFRGDMSDTSSMMQEDGDGVSATSSMVENGTQEFSATSSMVGNNKVGGGGNFMSKQEEVDSLVGMLTSDSATDTMGLETKLKNLLNNKVGGGINHNKVDDLSNVKHFFQKLRNDGVKVDLKLDDLTLSEFFNNNLSGGGMRKLGSKKAEPMRAEPKRAEPMRAEPKSEDESKVREGDNELVGGRDLPPALVAFQKIRALVAKELDLKGIKVSAKVASALKKEVAENNPKADAMEIAELSIKYFKEHKEKFAKLAKSLA